MNNEHIKTTRVALHRAIHIKLHIDPYDAVGLAHLRLLDDCCAMRLLADLFADMEVEVEAAMPRRNS